jgi:hypothetical protein
MAFRVRSINVLVPDAQQHELFEPLLRDDAWLLQDAEDARPIVVPYGLV